MLEPETTACARTGERDSYRASGSVFAACFLLVLAACATPEEARTVVPPVENVPATSALAGDGTSLGTTVDTEEVTATTLAVGTGSSATGSLAPPDIPTTTTGGTGTDEPDSGPDDPANIYALAGARAIAERVNRNGLAGLDADELAETLLLASEAAYEIEYPSVVTYLDVTQDDDANLVIVTEDDEQGSTGTAYVCIVAQRAIATEQACTTPGN